MAFGRSSVLCSIKCTYFDSAESNFISALLSLLSSSLAVCALINSEWMIIEDGTGKPPGAFIGNSTQPEEDLIKELTFIHAEQCQRIGTRHFWRAARFGSFVDMEGTSHIAYHSDGRVLVDCITPLVANLFYVLIALCFVVVVTSCVACILNILAPPSGFFHWLRRNTVLEMCNMLLALLACITSLLAECHVSSVRPSSRVSVGPGLFLIALSGLSAFLAATFSLRRTNRLARERRIQNKRMLCARSLRSWRDIGRRTEDTRPIIDFERYLDSSTATPLDVIRATPLDASRFEHH
uniref:Transmembrane protein 127 transmembrane region domain-containing protein n=1 Tax=Parascaris univalens TaxID=6257 RepID=A0A914ZKY7_PARUN